jgi:hypothetical protein
MQQDTSIEIARLDERLRGLDRLLEEREKQVRIAFVNAERAVEKAESAQRIVNTTQNEFRGALKDQAGTFATRAETDRLLERIQALERGESGGRGHSGGIKDSWATIISVFSLAATLVMAAFYLSHWASK